MKEMAIARLNKIVAKTYLGMKKAKKNERKKNSYVSEVEYTKDAKSVNKVPRHH